MTVGQNRLRAETKTTANKLSYHIAFDVKRTQNDIYQFCLTIEYVAILKLAFDKIPTKFNFKKQDELLSNSRIKAHGD